MNFGWESEREKLLRYMKIPPKKKLEWLRDMSEFAATLPKKTREIAKRLRKST